MPRSSESAATLAKPGRLTLERLLDKIDTRYLDAWQAEANLKSYREAVADVIEFRIGEGERFDMTPRSGWPSRATPRSPTSATRAARLGINIIWDPRAAEDARGLLPGPGRHRLRDRQVARRRAVRRPAVDGDQDRRPGRRQAVRRGDPRRVPGQDAGLQPVALVQLGHHRHERRGDARVPRGARASSASSSTSSPTAGTRSTAWPPRSSPPPCARTACWRWPGCSGSSAWSTRPTARRRRWSAARAPTPR